jgi:D-xylose transport system ATP-binding protein
MKVLSGLYPTGTYDGEILVDGKIMNFRNIVDAEAAGISIIHQELALVKDMTIGENIFLGREPKKYGAIQWESLYFETSKWLEAVGLKVNPETKVHSLGIGQQQLVEIAKALSKNTKILILDEPTAALTESEVETLIKLLEDLREKGVTCIYISHKMPEVFHLSDSITILRDGRSITTLDKKNTGEEKVISLMVGRELTERYPYVKKKPKEIVLETKNFTVWNKDNGLIKINKDINFKLHKGEILGIAGLMGAGRTELVMSLFGAYEGKKSGDIFINNKLVKINSVRDAIKAGIALVTEDRKRLGLVLGMDVKKNTTLASLMSVSRLGVLNDNEEFQESNKYKEKLKTKTASLETTVGSLSGGNQQKVVLAKWLMSKPQILILDEPTRGIDVGAKYEIYHLMNQLVEEGVAIIMISSELPEILGMSDRILVMNEGSFVKEFSRDEATQENIMLAATGGK